MVKLILIAGTVILPVIMTYARYQWRKICHLYNVMMLLSVIIFGNIAALSIYQIIKDNKVFMTAIHAVFLNPVFLITGAYIGIYTIYRLMLLGIKEWGNKGDDCR